MAKLDKSQGFTFAYTNLYELYKKAKNADLANHDIEVASPLAIRREIAPKQSTLRAEMGERAHVVPMGVREAEEKMERKAIPHAADPLEALRKNIDRLSDAQSRLRFLIQELDTITKKTSK